MALPILLRLLQGVVFLYVVASVLYTTYFYVLLPTIQPWRRPRPAPVEEIQVSPVPTPLRSASLFVDPPELDLALSSEQGLWAEGWPRGYTASGLVRFPPSELALQLGMSRAPGYGVPEETILSKAFSHALHPTRIIPYYFRATGDIDREDITITTLVTSNRFTVFRRLVKRYQGPISATVHIPLPLNVSLSSLPLDHPSRIALSRLHALYESSPLFAAHVDVHLALSPFTGPPSEGEGGRQFNVWRNVARLFARTDFVMMLDVDFAVCTDWRRDVRAAFARATAIGNIPMPRDTARVNGSGVDTVDTVKMLREGKVALVIPAFEYAKQEDGVDHRNFPTDKQSLLQLTQTTPPTITSFHASWAPGHNSTDYARYYSIPPGTGTVYKVERYQNAYEPYVIVSKHVSWCDERFAGYGANKAACLFEMYLGGVSFYVLADHFLIHQSHKYAEEARREERKTNRKLYSEFVEEACVRYVYGYYLEGTIHAAQGENAREECRKVKSVSRIVSQIYE